MAEQQHLDNVRGRPAARRRAAALRGVRQSATPAEVIAALCDSAIDVRVGRCHPRFNNPAGPGRDRATEGSV
jgi:hypothetical protein